MVNLKLILIYQLKHFHLILKVTTPKFSAAAIDTGIFHEATQSDEALFKRLCPPGKPLPQVMIRRLEKLGIAGRTPEEMNPGDRVRFSR